MTDELLITPAEHTEQASWWFDPRQDMDSSEIPCVPCRGRGVDRWREDCPACGGLGVVFA